MTKTSRAALLAALISSTANAAPPSPIPAGPELRAALETVRAELAVDPLVDGAALARLDLGFIRQRVEAGLVRCGRVDKDGCFTAIEIPAGLPLAGARAGIITWRIDLERRDKDYVLRHEALHAILWLLRDPRWHLGEKDLR